MIGPILFGAACAVLALLSVIEGVRSKINEDYWRNRCISRELDEEDRHRRLSEAGRKGALKTNAKRWGKNTND